MFVSKNLLELILRRISDFENRIKRLEMLEYERAQRTITSLSADTVNCGNNVRPIEEIIRKDSSRDIHQER